MAVDTTLYLLVLWLESGAFLVIQVQLQPRSYLYLGLRNRLFSWSCLYPKKQESSGLNSQWLLPVSHSVLYFSWKTSSAALWGHSVWGSSPSSLKFLFLRGKEYKQGFSDLSYLYLFASLRFTLLRFSLISYPVSIFFYVPPLKVCGRKLVSDNPLCICSSPKPGFL